MSKYVWIAVFVPVAHADKIRNVMGNWGAGKAGNYSHCSFSSKGVGRFIPLRGAKPKLGKVGRLEEVTEEKVEMICDKARLKKVILEMKKVHPYEEPAFYVYEYFRNP